jgi:hypothetical protein
MLSRSEASLCRASQTLRFAQGEASSVDAYYIALAAALQRRAQSLNHISSSSLAQEEDTRNAETTHVHPAR